MLTASFFNYTGPGRVAISRSVPRRMVAGYRRYKALAPGDFFHHTTDYEAFRSLYRQQLDRLDPAQIVADLHRLAGPAEPVLLCWCNLRAGSWCHRRIFSAWWSDYSGEEIAELPVSSGSKQFTLL